MAWRRNCSAVRPAHQTKWIFLAGRLEQRNREMRPNIRDAPERCRPGDIYLILRTKALTREHREAKARTLNSTGLKMEHRFFLGGPHSSLNK